jgi:tetratricopeptide (TPR) repeat protein
VDDAIAIAIREQENHWVLTLSHHAAVISNFLGNLEQVKHYYQQSLSFNPENPRALLGLANVLKEQGEPELAKSYAARCHKSLMHGDDFLKDARLETLLKEWPDIADQTSGPPVHMLRRWEMYVLFSVHPPKLPHACRQSRPSQWVDATLGRSPPERASIAKSRSRALLQTEHHPGSRSN